MNIQVQFKVLELITNQISYLEDQTISKIKEDKRKIYNLLLSVPGMGKITAATLLWEIGDWNRFDNKKKIAAYLGLTPSEYSSGENIKRGRITGQGNPQIRSLLIECAWLLGDCFLNRESLLKCGHSVRGQVSVKRIPPQI